MRTAYAGIDYSGGALVNIDKKTRIRYGIITVPYIWDALEEVCELCCPTCATHLKQGFDAKRCPGCYRKFEDGDFDSVKDHSYWEYKKDGLQLFIGHDSSDMWVFKSPVVTRAQFCSPCAPGACNLVSPCFAGPWVYCLPLDWFDEERPCPYADDIHTASKAKARIKKMTGPSFCF